MMSRIIFRSGCHKLARWFANLISTPPPAKCGNCLYKKGGGNY